MKRAFWMWVVLVVSFVAGCKDTAESQTKAWNANVEQVQKYQAKYGALRPVLAERLTEAKGIYDSAASLHGEQKVGKMAEANARLTDIVGPFQTHDTAVTELDALMVDKDVMSQPANVVNPVLDAAKAAKSKDASLMGSPAANSGQAKDHVAQATAALKAAADQLRAIKPKAPPPATPAKPAASPGKR